MTFLQPKPVLDHQAQAFASDGRRAHMILHRLSLAAPRSARIAGEVCRGAAQSAEEP